MEKSKLYVYMFRSRNKDNKDIDGFKERCKTFLEYEENEAKVLKAYNNFVKEGLIGEKTRLYKSVNTRNEDKIREELVVRLVRDKPSMTNIRRVLASVSQQACTRIESKWLIDFDVDDDKLVARFVLDLILFHGFLKEEIFIKKTPNGYAIIVPHGFDTRNIMERYSEYDITIKKDELLFMDIKENKSSEETCLNSAKLYAVQRIVSYTGWGAPEYGDIIKCFLNRDDANNFIKENYPDDNKSYPSYTVRAFDCGSNKDNE